MGKQHLNLIYHIFYKILNKKKLEVMAENNPIESPFLKIVTSSRYRTAPQPTDTLYTVKRKYNLEIQNTEIFNKVKLSNKPDSDKVIEFPVGHPEEDTFKIEAEVPASVLLASVLDLVPPDKENDPTHLSPELKEVKLVFEYVNTLSTVYLMNNMM